MQYIMSLDQGTTSSRCILFDKSGNICSVVNKEFRQIFPQPGWVEHDANEIWNTTYEVAHAAMAKLNITAQDIAAIGITNQRETTIIWDRETGEPIANAIVWQCRRTSDIIDGLVAAGHADEIRSKTGLIPDAYFSGSKIQWLLDNVPGARRRAAAGKLLFGTVDTWLIWKLTGGRVHVTDYTNAGRGRQAPLRHGGHLAHLEAHRRQGPCDGLHQRQPHHALQHPHPAVGRGTFEADEHPGHDAAGGQALELRLRQDRF